MPFTKNIHYNLVEKKNLPKKLYIYLSVAKWLLGHGNMVTHGPDRLHDVFVKRWRFLIKHHGLAYSIENLKVSRLIVLRYLSGRPLRTMTGVRITTDGIPTFLGEWIPFIRKGDPAALRILLTYLFAGRVIRIEGPVDYSTIEHKGSIDTSLHISDRDIEQFIGWVGGRPSLEEVDGFFRSSMGPSQKGMLGLLHEASSLSGSLYESVLFLLKRHGDTFYSSLLSESRALGSDELDYQIAGRPNSTRDVWPRRLSHLVDREGKMRVIAIFDWWSQLSLKPLHNTLNGILRKIKGDCTYDQGKFLTLVRPSDVECFSFDLKSATDLMPMHLQKRLISGLIDEEYSDNWHQIMVGTGFRTPRGDQIHYGTGQPMGAYSSWPTMALTHHLIVFAAYSRTSKNVPLRYALLGDDLVIQGEEHARSYRSIVDCLGMEVSDVKTFRSFDLIEFAKRFPFRDTEITPFPVGTLIDASDGFHMISEAFKNASDRGWDNIVLTQSMVYQVLVALNIRNKRRRLYIAKKLVEYSNCLVPYSRDWDHDFETALSRWIKPHEFNLGCSTPVEFQRQFLLEAYASVKSEWVHTQVRRTVQNFNTLVPTLVFASGDGRSIILKILNSIAKKVLVESSVSPDPERIPELFRQMVELDTNVFLPMPVDISKLFLGTNFEKRVKTAALVNDHFRKVLLSWNDSRDNLLRE